MMFYSPFQSSYNRFMRIFLPALLLMGLLAGCITVETKTPAPPHFVTSTLPAGPAATATLTATPEGSLPRPEDCTDKAILMEDVTILDGTRMPRGQSFTKTWRLKNMGTCPWDASYSLVFLAGERMRAPDSTPLTVTLAGSTVDVSVNLAAPSVDGSYTGIFALRNPLGQTVPIGLSTNIWVNIIVGSGTSAVSPLDGATSAPGGIVPIKSAANCSVSLNEGYVSQLLDLINAARREASLPALTLNPQLTAAAQGHSTDMACNNFLSHIGSDGSLIHERLRAAGYMNVGFLEIIAIGTPRDAMNQWRNDAGHWEAVLNPGVTEIGIGYAYSAHSDYGGYITVDMGGR
jgi:uncharacterized protein YkwD